MISLARAEPGMLLRMRVQPIQVVNPKMTFNMVAKAIETGVAWAALRDGQPVAIGGVAPQSDERAVVWGVLSDSIGASMTSVHRAVRHTLDVLTYPRLEAHVAVEHEEGHRWIALLGFEREGVMRKFFRGRDFALYARVR